MAKKRAFEKLKRFNRKVKRVFTNPFTYVGIVVFIVICACTYVIGVTELTSINEEYEIGGWNDAIWQTIVTVSAAYFDYYMKTVPGRFAALFLLLFGMIVFSFVTGKITSGFMNILMKGNKGLKKLRGMKDHFIICGWRPGFDKILEAVMQSNPDITTDMIVLVNEAPSEQIEQLRSELQFKDINYIAGDFADTEVLSRACVKAAERVLIISDASKNQSEMETDSQTVLAVLTMKNLNPNLYIAAELLDKKFEEHLQLANCDEILLTQEYEHSLLATASSGMGYSNVIKSLIADDAESGIIIDDIPSSFIGQTYREFLDSFNDKSDEALVGLLLNTERTHKKNTGNVKSEEKASEPYRYNMPLLTPSDDFIIPKNSKSILICANH